MKCIVLSDTHGHIETAKRALRLNPDAEVVFFLGDGLEDIEFISNDCKNVAWICVRGNCDTYPYFKGEGVKSVESITLEGKRIVLTHGHLYGAKSGIGALTYLAREEGADIVLFGHTHTPCEIYISEFEKPFYLFNPGSASGYDPGFGVIQLKPGCEPLLSHGKACADKYEK